MRLRLVEAGMTSRWPAGREATYLIRPSPQDWSPRLMKGRAAAARLSAALAGRREITIEPCEGMVSPGDQASDESHYAFSNPKVFVAPEECGKIAEVGLILRILAEHSYFSSMFPFCEVWSWHYVWIMKDGSLSCLRLIREIPGTISAGIIQWMNQDSLKNP
jgi:hypothetical protein